MGMGMLRGLCGRGWGGGEGKGEAGRDGRFGG